MRVCDAMLPRFALDFGIGVDRAAILITGFSIAYGVMLVVYGPLGDRVGKLRLVVVCGALSSLWAAGCALAPSFSALAAARILAGGTAAGVIPLAMAWIGDAVPFARRQPVMAWFFLGQILGVGSGQLMGGVAADTFGWRGAFAGIAVWFAMASALLFVMSRRRAMHASALSGGVGWLAGLRTVLGTRWARVVTLTGFVEGAAVFAALAFAALHFHRSLGVSLTQAGAMAMGFGAGGLLYVAFSRRIVARLGEVVVSRLGGAVMGLGFIAVAFADSAPWGFAAMLAAGIGYYLLHTTLQLQASQMTPSNRGAAIGVFATAFFFGQAMGVAVAGAVVERTGTVPVLVACGAIIVVLGLVFARAGAGMMARARAGA